MMDEDDDDDGDVFFYMITRSPSGLVAFVMYMYVSVGLFFPQGERVSQ